MNTRIVSLVLFFASLSLEASLLDHVKPALNKGDNHSMEGVDFIYTINLDGRPEKFQGCVDQLQPYGICPYRFSAVNGWELSLETINDIGVCVTEEMNKNISGICFEGPGGQFYRENPLQVGKVYFCDGMSRGAIGIILSHLSVMKDAYDAGYQTVWVMEDDIEILQDPHLISQKIKELDAFVGSDGWDILFTDQDTKRRDGSYVPCRSHARRPNFTYEDPSCFYKTHQVLGSFARTGARYGGYSMIVRRSGMKKMIDFLDAYQAFLPYDLDYIFPAGMRLFVLREDIVSTLPAALTDNGYPGYQRKKGG